MTWLIVGGSGQLGKALGRELEERGIEFISANSTELDLRKHLIVKQFIEEIKPKVIINAAAYTNVDGAETDRFNAWAVNAEGAGNLAIAARQVGAVFAHVSTDYVFSGISSTPYLEQDLPGPFNVYGESKAAGEQFVQVAYPERIYIFRTAWLYSADGKNFVKNILRKALSGSEAKVVNDQIGQPTFAGDVAKKIIESIEGNLKLGIYHATNSGEATWFDFAQEIYRLAGADPNLVKTIVSSELDLKAKRPSYSVLSHQRWSDEGVTPMREWKIALAEAMPSIISSVKAEG